MAKQDMTYYTSDEVASILKVNPESVRRWVRDGRLESVKLGGRYNRIPKSALDQFIKNQS